MSPLLRIPRRAVTALTLVWLLCFTIGTAFALGTLTYARREITESNGGWHLAMTIVLPQAPVTPHQVFKFSFTPTSYFERFLDDAHGEKPQLRKQPLVGQTPIVESVDVDFSDARGKTFNRTHFDFNIPRSHNFSAGEYTVNVRRGDGAQIGNAQTLVLLGDNPIIDRRAISFVDSKTGDKKKAAAAPATSSAPEKAAEPPKDKEPAASEETAPAPAGSAEPAAPDTADAEKVPPSARGCGCRAAGQSAELAAAWGLVLGLGLAIARRRRPR
jgi:MYXO-CTERM domain-containing protein